MNNRMEILYIDCGMGAAGDMLMGALVSLLPSETEQNKFIDQLNHIGIPGITVVLSDDKKCGILGKHVSVRIHGQEEESCDAHEHMQEHHHHHHHHHASMAEIEDMIGHLKISEKVRSDVSAIYQRIAEAESSVHGTEVSEIHFHEVGMADALCDIAGCAMLLERLHPSRIIASPINVGYGKVHCAHGILPVPAPATVQLLKGIPCYAGRIEGELCTPTGAALIGYYADQYAQMPPMTICNVGYGTGKKDFEAANVVRTILGQTEGTGDEIIELACNMDDMTPEELGYTQELLLKQGALDVYTTSIGMKKSRPGVLLTVMCREQDRDSIIRLIFQHTSTIGIREKRCDRIVLERREKTLHSSIGDVRVKESYGYGLVKRKLEYEDLKKAADQQGISLHEAGKIIEKENPESEQQ